MRIALAVIALFAFAGAAVAQQQAQTQPQCRPNSQGRVEDLQACYAASAPGSTARVFAAINLGSDAASRNDYVTAVRYFDEAQPHDGTVLYSDAGFHAQYANTLQQVGRVGEALEQARMALALLRNDPSLPEPVRAQFANMPVDREGALALLLPIFYAAGAPETQSVRQDYMAFAPEDWIGWSNRAAVLQQIGDLPGALTASERAIRLAPNEPGALNNHCYILALNNRAAEGVPYCERAVAALPQIAGIRHSLAFALAGAGQCVRAREELARVRQLDPLSPEYQQDIPCTPARR